MGPTSFLLNPISLRVYISIHAERRDMKLKCEDDQSWLRIFGPMLFIA